MTKYLVDPDALIEAYVVRYPLTVFAGPWEWASGLARERRLSAVADSKPSLTATGLRQWLDRQPSQFFRNPTAEEADATATIADLIGADVRYSDAAKAEFLGSADLPLLAHAHGHGFSVVTYDVSIPDSEAIVSLVDVAAEIGVETLPWHAMLVAEGASF